LFFHGYQHFLSHHALRAHNLSFEAAVHKMTGAVADHFGIVERGRIGPGAHADLVLWDPERLRDTNTFAMPDRYATAARHVWVNGIAVVRDGRRTQARPGVRLDRNNVC
jgi:N-acyl-D-amino-acid deacylase